MLVFSGRAEALGGAGKIVDDVKNYERNVEKLLETLPGISFVDEDDGDET